MSTTTEPTSPTASIPIGRYGLPCPNALNRTVEDNRQAALAVHAPRVVELAERGLALAKEWAEFEDEVFKTNPDPRIPPDSRHLGVYGGSVGLLRLLCEGMRDRSLRFIAP